MLLVLLACVSPPDGSEDPDGVGDDPSQLPGDTASEPDTDTGEEPEGGYDFLFGLDEVHTIDITLGEASLRALRTTPKEYVEGDVVVDGEAFGSVGVRLKGSGSFADLRGKAAFKIDFNRYDPEQDFHGKGKFTLNNMTHDETQVHEVVAYAAFAAVGAPRVRVGYAWVTVNGKDYGLYSNVETPDRDVLEANFGHREGTLYEGGYPYYPDAWDHADFTSSEAHNFELEVGEDRQWADIDAVVAALDADPMEPALAEVVDLDAYVRFQITEAWTGQWDGYAFASNNFRVYIDHGGDGRLRMVPTGLDYCFTDYGGRLSSAMSPLGRACQGDGACVAHFLAQAPDTFAAIDAAGLEALMDEALTLTRPYIEADPRNVIDEDTALDPAIERMREWIRTRTATVDRWY